MFSVVAKFFWLFVRHCQSPIKVYNVLTWDRVVMVGGLVAGLEINFVRMIVADIQERAFKTSTITPFVYFLPNV